MTEATGLEDWHDLSELPSVDEFTSGQTAYRPPFTEELAGRTFELIGPDGQRLGLRMVDGHRLEQVRGEEVQHLRYDATQVRPGIFLLDYFDPSWPLGDAAAGYPRGITWALDAEQGRATAAISGITREPHAQQGLQVRAQTRHEFWSTDAGATPHPRTAGHVGNRVLWRYSETDHYEHIYLNSSAFAWQCLRGVERGLSELDRSRAYEIAPDLYFFHWSEHHLVVETALFIDLEQFKTFGRFFALETRDGVVRHHQFGARGELLGRVDYPSDDVPV